MREDFVYVFFHALNLRSSNILSNSKAMSIQTGQANPIKIYNSNSFDTWSSEHINNMRADTSNTEYNYKWIF